MADIGIHNAGSFGTRGIVTAAGGNYVDRYMILSTDMHVFVHVYTSVCIYIIYVYVHPYSYVLVNNFSNNS